MLSWEMYINDPDTCRINLKDYKARARELIEAFVSIADVVAGPPGSYHDAVWPPVFLSTPSFVVVDEAGRLTEAMSLVSFAQYPDTPVVFVGEYETIRTHGGDCHGS
jgi:hypothetical protein